MSHLGVLYYSKPWGYTRRVEQETNLTGWGRGWTDLEEQMVTIVQHITLAPRVKDRVLWLDQYGLRYELWCGCWDMRYRPPWLRDSSPLYRSLVVEWLRNMCTMDWDKKIGKSVEVSPHLSPFNGWHWRNEVTRSRIYGFMCITLTKVVP